MLHLHIGLRLGDININFFEQFTSERCVGLFAGFDFTTGKFPQSALIQMIGAALVDPEVMDSEQLSKELLEAGLIDPKLLDS